MTCRNTWYLLTVTPFTGTSPRNDAAVAAPGRIGRSPPGRRSSSVPPHAVEKARRGPFPGATLRATVPLVDTGAFTRRYPPAPRTGRGDRGEDARHRRAAGASGNGAGGGGMGMGASA